MHYLFIRFCIITLFISGASSLDLSATPEVMQSNESFKISEENYDDNNNLNNSKNETLPPSESIDNIKEAEVDYEDPIETIVEAEGDNEVISDRRHERRQRKKSSANRVGITYTWDRWEKWSRCTSSCVQIRKRLCLKRIQNMTNGPVEELSFYPDLMADSIIGCQGIMKKYRLCKDERCTNRSVEEMRNEQCASFNSIIIRGRFHQWLGHVNDHNECTLFCRAKDSDLVMDMNKLVMDGTPCERPSIYYTHYYRRRAVCVEGICRAVHASGAIRPSNTKDSREKCGSMLCERVNEIFTQPKLNFGYNFITTIPAGAMNLTIQEMGKSDNMLALKTKDEQFILNGYNKPSEGGLYEYNDDTFDYNKEGSIILAKGPLNNPVVLMLLVQGLNSGVHYSYALPVPSASIAAEKDDSPQHWNELGQPLNELGEHYVTVPSATKTENTNRSSIYSWEVLGFGQCNRSCGPGIQLPILRCVRKSPGKETAQSRYYSPKRCAIAPKPTFDEVIYHCNRGLCPAYWKTGDFGKCECLEGVAEGLKRRDVQCLQEQVSGNVEEVDESKCYEVRRPEAKERCNCKKIKLYSRSPEKSNQMYARLIGSPNIIKNNMNKRHSANSSVTTPLKRHYRDDKTGVWVMSDWSKQCSKDCIYPYEHRTIHCDRTAPYTDPCDQLAVPETKRTCTNRSQTCRRGMWFASDWSNCTGECTNRRRIRKVLCVLDGLVVDIKQCDLKLKPIVETPCTNKDVAFCGPKWHYSEWSECSRSCGEGVQRRYAKCLEFDWKQKIMVESNKCKYMEREPVYGACSLAKCEELRAQNLIVDSKAISLPQNRGVALANGGGNVGNGVERYENDVDAATDYDYENDYNNNNNNNNNAVNVGGGGGGGGGGVGEYNFDNFHDLSGGNEKLVIAAAPKILQNCREELNNCKRINRERLCKLDYYKTHCCLTCHGYY